MDVSWYGPDCQCHQTSSSPSRTFPGSVASFTLVTALCLVLTLDTVQCNPSKQAVPPFIQNQPFLVIWNVPTEKCRTHRGVDLHLDNFQIITNKKEAFMGGNVTIFYIDQLGKYPFYEDGIAVNGGCPQNASLIEHSNKMAADIQRYMTSKFYKGLAVIDWEEWRPQWVRNWGNKAIYRQKSQELVQARYPNWLPQRVLKQAQWEFDTTAKKFMTQTLRVGQTMRPTAWWGFYLFPDCYNYDYNSNFSTYTGQCPAIEIERNNELLWLWSHSKALYPSIYMEEILKSSEQGKNFVRARVQEAMRVALMTNSKYALPVFVYSRSHYAYTFTPMTQNDLIHTIGESAALGASAVILWGGIEFSHTKARCQHVQNYVRQMLGPYVLNVTIAAQVCSHFLCSKHGRCRRRDPEGNTYLHLNKRSFQIIEQTDHSSLRVYTKGELSSADKRQLKQEFICHCYKGWKGKYCGRPKSPGLRCHGGSPLFIAALSLLMMWFLP
ncbi:hyaluronidase-4-like [Heptranchias perlo]|uniref:hyaluronidase-4-like n=1 Tax=Heptranchias perlo TaxID=212740 RepID=UPI0035597A5C